jgi:hypothetical protein
LPHRARSSPTLHPPGALSPDRDITLSEYKDRWLEMIESEAKPRTLASYTQLLDLHIAPAFGRVRLRELSRAMVKRLLLKKREAGPRQEFPSADPRDVIRDVFRCC